MDTTVGAWLEGYRRICVVTILDDYSRAVVAARVFPTDSSYHSLLALRQAMERYGRPRVLYTDPRLGLLAWLCQEVAELYRGRPGGGQRGL